MRSMVFGGLIAALVACSSSNNNRPVCGDGVVEGSEQCDDGAANGTATSSCTAACTVVVANPVCGDGHVDAGEQCDEGAQNGQPGSHCTATCTGLAYVTAHWSIDCMTGDVNACTPGCPAGYDTAQVVSQKVDTTGNPVGAPKIDLFNCANGMGTTVALSSGLYHEYIAITTADGSSTYAQSLLHDLDLTTADGTFTDSIKANGGYFHATWTLKGAISQTTLTCAQAGASGAEVISTVSGASMGVSDIFTCDDGQGTTGALVEGPYVLSFDAVDNAQPPNALGPSTLVNATMLGQNQVVEVPNQPVVISIDGK